jgi:hypothetical protein
MGAKMLKRQKGGKVKAPAPAMVSQPVLLPPMREEAWRAPGLGISHRSPSTSGEIVDQHALDQSLNEIRHKFLMLRVDLVFVLGFFVGKNKIQPNLIGLIHHGPRAAHHFPRVIMKQAGDALEMLIAGGQEFVSCVRLCRVRPEQDNV